MCGPGCVSAVFDGADWDAPRIACLVALVICSIGERGNPRLGLTARPRDAAQLMWFVGKDRPSPGTGELLLRLSQGSSKRQDLCCRSVAGTANATGEIFSFVLPASSQPAVINASQARAAAAGDTRAVTSQAASGALPPGCRAAPPDWPPRLPLPIRPTRPRRPPRFVDRTYP